MGQQTIQIVLIVLCFFLSSSYGVGQNLVQGVVIGQDGFGLPGVAVVEKGTDNGVLTNMEGEFSIQVSDANAVLSFSFVGFKSEDVQIEGQEELAINLKEDVIRCFFDGNDMAIYLKSGLINAPLGGQVNLSVPLLPYFLFGQTILVGKFGYQTDLNDNVFVDYGAAFEHLVVESYFDIDASFSLRRFNWNSASTFHSKQVEGQLNYHKPIIFPNTTSFFIGYGKSEIENTEVSQRKNSGYTLGIGKVIGRNLWIEVIGKATYWEDFWEFQGEIKREFKYLRVGTQYSKIDDFNEVSLMLGINFNYF